MKPEIKARWLDALRGGEYNQARRMLKDGDSFCCLGVLCDLHSREVDGVWEESVGKNSYYLDSMSVLPSEVRDWAGLESKNPFVDGNEVAALNDQGKTFAEIADLVEKHL